MRKTASVFTVIMAVMIAGMVAMFLGCSEKVGPAGPKGVAGDDGVAKCGTCHNVSTTVLARQVQWGNSGHAVNGNYARSDASCAPCHTHEGFRETLGTTHPKTAAAKITNPTPQNCRTCHNIHKNYDSTDFDLATTAPVQLLGGGTYNLGKSNICAECHQQRPTSPMPTVAHADTATLRFTSNRFGPHYGSQSSVLIGKGGYEIKGSVTYESSPHGTMVTNGCVTCHGATPYGNQSGGHTLKMAYDYHGTITPNVSGCVSCHSTTKNFDVNGVQTEVTALMKELKDLLIAKKLLRDDDLTVAGTYPVDQVGALFNYRMLLGDASHGVHNAKYTKALLKNSIAYMKTVQ